MSATQVSSVSILPLGVLTLDQSILTYHERRGQAVDVPVTAVFIEMADGQHMLFDTGISPTVRENGDLVPDRLSALIARFGREDDIRHHLAQLGHRPEDVKIVVNSHLHWDHCGGNHLFSGAAFVSQSREIRFAGCPDPFVRRVYVPRQYDWIETMQVLEGDRVLAPGVAVLSTPGHSPGHQSMLVRLPSGKLMILTGDAVFCPANFDPARPPGNAHRPDEAVQSIQRINMLGEFLQAGVVICHDPDLWQSWQPCPHRYQ